MQLSESVVAVFLLVLLPPAPVNTQQARCENVTSDRDTGGSCSFRNQQLCGWTNMADRDQLDWKLEDNSYLGQNSYMVMDVSRASAGNVGYFASPTFCSTGSDLRSLSFRYSIELGGRCRLSVMLVTEADAIEMWSTSTATGVSFSDMVDPIYFRCPGDRFKIVFVGEKLSNRRCGKYYNEVDIDDISYSSTGQSRTQGYVCAAVSNVTSPPTTTATSPTTTSTTTAPSPVSTPLPPVTGVTDDTEDSTQFPRNSTQPGQGRPQTDANGGLSGGAIAGVVIVVIVIIAAVVVVIGIFLVRRKRAEAEKKTNQPPIQHGNSINNSMYMLARLHPGTAGNRPDVIPSAPHLMTTHLSTTSRTTQTSPPSTASQTTLTFRLPLQGHPRSLQDTSCPRRYNLQTVTLAQDRSILQREELEKASLRTLAVKAGIVVTMN